ncbi:hypothetical protein ACFWN7_09095 [Agromyces sp. NPDC058484]|uniref:hypothetical protein n=1 Tax=Agromyces sp. NPDC058484 TaxID=3346524 RepID=UPI003668D9B1
MTMTLKAKQRRRQRRRAIAYVVITAGWAASIWLGATLTPPGWLHAIALFIHLASLVVSLGAVLAVEWYGLLWATEWRSVRDVARIDITMKLPIWTGLVGLLASGALLQPDLASPATFVKLGAVLIASLNGVALTRWTDRLSRFPRKLRFRALPRKARTWYVASAVVSQVAWWTAVIIGMLNSTT